VGWPLRESLAEESWDSNWLRVLIVLGGMMSAFGMFNALVLQPIRTHAWRWRADGMLPKFFWPRSAQGTRGPALTWPLLGLAATFAGRCAWGLGFKAAGYAGDSMLYG